MDTLDIVKTVTLTPKAVSTVHAMRNKIDDIGRHYGYMSNEYVSANATFMGSIVTLITLGGHITADGELSLFASTTEGFSYGMNWHAKSAPEEYSNFPDYGTWSINS